MGLSCVTQLAGVIELAKHCGWWAPYKDACILQHRPERISFDAQRRLHHENGPAIRYRDGFSVYAWHGTRVPGEWIENRKKLTPKIALTWSNIEQRRAACEILGWENILSELNARSLDKDDDPLIGELVEVEIPDVGREKFLRVLCGTGRKFALPVPPDMQTALQANAWTFGLDEKTFTKPEIRT